MELLFLAKAHRPASAGEATLTLLILLVVVCAVASQVIPMWIRAYKKDRERKRWAEVSQAIPSLSTPQLPRFEESPYTIRGMKYDAWLKEFKSWSHSWGDRGLRTKKGKQYAAEDRRWHTFFSEWEKIFLKPVLDQINKRAKEESDNRRSRLREEYRRRFGVNPPDASIPERFFPLSGPSIASCYVWKGYRNRRNNHV